MNTCKFMGIFALAFALAGCQSGNSNSTASSHPTTPTPTTNPTPTPTPTPVPSATYKISGTITGGTITGVTITATPGGAAVVTGNSGTYTLPNLPNGDYTITPSYSGISFTPASTTVTVSGGNVGGVNFSDSLSALKEGKLLYPCQSAICQKVLATGAQTVVVVPPSPYGQQQPVNLVPFRSGDRIAYEGSNTDGIWTASLSPGAPAPVQVINGSLNLTTNCYSVGDSFFDVAHTGVGDITAASVDCAKPGENGTSNIFLIKMNKTSYHVQVTDDQKIETSPVFAGVDSKTGDVAVLYISTRNVPALQPGSDKVSTIWEQVVDTNKGTLVGEPTVFATNVVNDSRALSVNAARTEVAFVQDVGGAHHIFVKPISGGTAVDLGPGDDPYWSLEPIGDSSLILYTADERSNTPQLRAVSPDGALRYSVPTPSNIEEAPWIGSTVTVVFAPPGS